MNNTEKKQNNRKIIIEAFNKYIESVDDGKKLYQLRKYVERFNNIDEFSQYIVMTDMFEIFKGKVREGEQDTAERECFRVGHDLGKWKETSIIKKRYDSKLKKEVTWKEKSWLGVCKRCGYEEYRETMPDEVKAEKEKQIVKRKKEIQKLQREIEDLENNK